MVNFLKKSNKNLKNNKITKKIKKNNNKNKNNNNSNVIKINNDFYSQNFVHVNKIKIFLGICLLVFIVLICRIGYIQFVEGSNLKAEANKQQTLNQIISPKRGTIYDSTGQILATSASVDTITVNPKLIKASGKDTGKTDEEATAELKTNIAKALSEIFELDYNEVFEKLNSSSQVETIVRKVEQEKVDKLKDWMKTNKVTVGINIDEDTKRYYPYGTLLSQVLGSCGNDNQGLSGIENKWNSILSGVPGKIVSSKSGSSKEIPGAQKKYIEVENGGNLVLTIDVKIQSKVEKYLQEVVESGDCKEGGSCIVMDPKTGDILAMATYPNYDLNSPFTPNSTLAKTYDKLTPEEQTNSIYKMWSNKSVSELYEPGSVFKIITSSIALEENIINPYDVIFNCKGYEMVDGIKISCWRSYEPHGLQNLKQALQNSCNPAFVQLISKINTDTLYKYYKAFGFFDKTGIELPYEPNSIFRPKETLVNHEKASMSFGQALSITPLQMITSVSSIGNNGILMKPRLVKEVIDSDTGAVNVIEPEEVRQVISKNTANTMKELLQSVAQKPGTAWRGAVEGYTIGAKTGTSEVQNTNKDNDFVASYFALAPIEDTKVSLLLTLYDPDEGNHNGGTLAGPAVSKMLAEILPNLNVPSEIEEIENGGLISVPDVRNKTIAEAEKVLKNAGFNVKVDTNNDKNISLVVDQMPKPGVQLLKDSTIMLYDNTTRVSTTVPNLLGKTASQAISALKEANLNITIIGEGKVESQDIAPDTKVDACSVVTVTLK